MALNSHSVSRYCHTLGRTPHPPGVSWGMGLLYMGLLLERTLCSKRGRTLRLLCRSTTPYTTEMDSTSAIRAKARHLALAELAKAHPDEYRDLYRGHVDLLRTLINIPPDSPAKQEARKTATATMVEEEAAQSVKATEALLEPALADPETCEHKFHSKAEDGITTCHHCGSKRPYFSWVPPAG